MQYIKFAMSAALITVACFSTGACTASVSPVEQAAPSVAVSEDSARTEIALRAGLLVHEGNFGEIDRVYGEYLSDARRTPSGLWAVGIFQDATISTLIGSREPSSDADWDALETVTLNWAKSAPESALAPIVHAEVIKARAWRIRGQGSARTVQKEAWTPFYAHLKRARTYLQKQSAVASKDPNYYALMITLMRESSDDSDPRLVFDEGVKKFPGYYPIYFSMLAYLLPMWHGDAQSIETFARDATARTRKIEGDGMYARIYWFAAQAQYREGVFDQSSVDWKMMRSGFEDIIKRYPDQWNLQHYMRFACLAGDAETVRGLLPKVREPVDRILIWDGVPDYDDCKRSARGKSD